MADIGTSWQRADGVVVAPSQASGIARAITYTFAGAWRMGGSGNVVRVGHAATRDFPDDTFVERAAPRGAPATLTISPEGDEMLVVWGEIWGVSDCPDAPGTTPLPPPVSTTPGGGV